MTNRELINQLSQLPRDWPVYVYDDLADVERSITEVSTGNDLMPLGVVIEIRGHYAADHGTDRPAT